MANQDFFVTFGSDADTFAGKLRQDLQPARTEVVSLIRALAALPGVAERSMNELRKNLGTDLQVNVGVGEGNREAPPARTSAGVSGEDQSRQIAAAFNSMKAGITELTDGLKAHDAVFNDITARLAAAAADIQAAARGVRDRSATNNRSEGQTGANEELGPRNRDEDGRLAAGRGDPVPRPAAPPAPSIATATIPTAAPSVVTVSQAVINDAELIRLTAAVERGVSATKAVEQAIDRLREQGQQQPRENGQPSAPSAATPTAATAPVAASAAGQASSAQASLQPNAAQLSQARGIAEQMDTGDPKVTLAQLRRAQEQMQQEYEAIKAAGGTAQTIRNYEEGLARVEGRIQASLQDIADLGAPAEAPTAGIERAGDAALTELQQDLAQLQAVRDGLDPNRRSKIVEVQRDIARVEQQIQARHQELDNSAYSPEELARRQSLPHPERARIAQDLRAPADSEAFLRRVSNRNDPEAIDATSLRSIAESFAQQGYGQQIGRVGTRTTKEEIAQRVLDARREFEARGGATEHELTTNAQAPAQLSTRLKSNMRAIDEAWQRAKELSADDLAAREVLKRDLQAGGQTPFTKAGGINERAGLSTPQGMFMGADPSTKGRSKVQYLSAGAYGGADEEILKNARTLINERAGRVQGAKAQAALDDALRNVANPAFQPYEMRGDISSGRGAGEEHAKLSALQSATTAVDKVIGELAQLTDVSNRAENKVADLKSQLDALYRTPNLDVDGKTEQRRVQRDLESAERDAATARTRLDSAVTPAFREANPGLVETLTSPQVLEARRRREQSRLDSEDINRRQANTGGSNYGLLRSSLIETLFKSSTGYQVTGGSGLAAQQARRDRVTVLPGVEERSGQLFPTKRAEDEGVNPSTPEYASFRKSFQTVLSAMNDVAKANVEIGADSDQALAAQGEYEDALRKMIRQYERAYGRLNGESVTDLDNLVRSLAQRVAQIQAGVEANNRSYNAQAAQAKQERSLPAEESASLTPDARHANEALTKLAKQADGLVKLLELEAEAASAVLSEAEGKVANARRRAISHLSGDERLPERAQRDVNTTLAGQLGIQGEDYTALRKGFGSRDELTAHLSRRVEDEARPKTNTGKPLTEVAADVLAQLRHLLGVTAEDLSEVSRRGEAGGQATISEARNQRAQADAASLAASLSELAAQAKERPAAPDYSPKAVAQDRDLSYSVTAEAYTEAMKVAAGEIDHSTKLIGEINRRLLKASGRPADQFEGKGAALTRSLVADPLLTRVYGPEAQDRRARERAEPTITRVLPSPEDASPAAAALNESGMTALRRAEALLAGNIELSAMQIGALNKRLAAAAGADFEGFRGRGTSATSELVGMLGGAGGRGGALPPGGSSSTSGGAFSDDGVERIVAAVNRVNATLKSGLRVSGAVTGTTEEQPAQAAQSGRTYKKASTGTAARGQLLDEPARRKFESDLGDDGLRNMLVAARQSGQMIDSVTAAVELLKKGIRTTTWNYFRGELNQDAEAAKTFRDEVLKAEAAAKAVKDAARAKAVGPVTTEKPDRAYNAEAPSTSRQARDQFIAGLPTEELRDSVLQARLSKDSFDAVTSSLKLLGANVPKQQVLNLFRDELEQSSRAAEDFARQLDDAVRAEGLAAANIRASEAVTAKARTEAEKNRLGDQRSARDIGLKAGQETENQRLAAIKRDLSAATRAEVDALDREKRAGAGAADIAARQRAIYKGLINDSRELAAAQGKRLPDANNLDATFQVLSRSAGVTADKTSATNIRTSVFAETGLKDVDFTREITKGAKVPEGGIYSKLGTALFGNTGFVGRILRSTGEFVTRFFSGVFVYGIANAVQDALGQAIQTQSTFVQVSQALEQTGRSSDGLRTKLMGLSEDYGVALKDVYTTAAGLTGLFNSTDIGNDKLVGMTRVATQLQLVSNGTVNATEAMRSLTSITSAYADTTPEHIADIATVISNRLSVNIEETIEGMARLSGQTANLGISAERAAVYTAAIAKFTGQTGAGAGEQFSRILSSLQTGSVQSKVTEQFQAAGVDLSGAFANRDYGAILDTIATKYSKLNKAQKDVVATTIGGQRQASAINAILIEGGKIVQTVTDAEQSRGATEQRAQEISKQLAAQLNKTRQEFVLLFTNVADLGGFELFKDALILVVGLLKAANFLLGQLRNLLEALPGGDTIKSMAGLILGLGVAVAVGARAWEGLAGSIRKVKEAVDGVAKLDRLILGAPELAPGATSVAAPVVAGAPAAGAAAAGGVATAKAAGSAAVAAEAAGGAAASAQAAAVAGAAAVAETTAATGVAAQAAGAAALSAEAAAATGAAATAEATAAATVAATAATEAAVASGSTGRFLAGLETRRYGFPLQPGEELTTRAQRRGRVDPETGLPLSGQGRFVGRASQFTEDRAQGMSNRAARLEKAAARRTAVIGDADAGSLSRLGARAARPGLGALAKGSEAAAERLGGLATSLQFLSRSTLALGGVLGIAVAAIGFAIAGFQRRAEINKRYQDAFDARFGPKEKADSDANKVATRDAALQSAVDDNTKSYTGRSPLAFARGMFNYAVDAIGAPETRANLKRGFGGRFAGEQDTAWNPITFADRVTDRETGTLPEADQRSLNALKTSGTNSLMRLQAQGASAEEIEKQQKTISIAIQAEADRLDNSNLSGEQKQTEAAALDDFEVWMFQMVTGMKLRADGLNKADTLSADQVEKVPEFVKTLQSASPTALRENPKLYEEYATSIGFANDASFHTLAEQLIDPETGEAQRRKSGVELLRVGLRAAEDRVAVAKEKSGAGSDEYKNELTNAMKLREALDSAVKDELSATGDAATQMAEDLARRGDFAGAAAATQVAIDELKQKIKDASPKPGTSPIIDYGNTVKTPSGAVMPTQLPPMEPPVQKPIVPPGAIAPPPMTAFPPVRTPSGAMMPGDLPAPEAPTPPPVKTPSGAMMPGALPVPTSVTPGEEGSEGDPEALRLYKQQVAAYEDQKIKYAIRAATVGLEMAKASTSNQTTLARIDASIAKEAARIYAEQFAKGEGDATENARLQADATQTARRLLEATREQDIAGFAPGDLVKAAHQRTLNAQADLDAIDPKKFKDPNDYKSAVKDQQAVVLQSQRAETKATQDVDAAQSEYNAVRFQGQGDVIAAAKEHHKQALAQVEIEKVNAGKTGTVTVGLLAAQRNLEQSNQEERSANEQLLTAQNNLQLALLNMSGDTVGAAGASVAQAQARLDAARKKAREGGDSNPEDNPDVVQARADLINSQASERDAVFQDSLGTIDFNLEMKQITSQQAIAQLQEMLNNKKNTRDQDREIRRRIKGLNDTLNSAVGATQFNLGNFKLPTVYEVRRSLGLDTYGDIMTENVKAIGEMRKQTGAGALKGPGGVLDSVGGGASVQDNSTHTLTLNGVSFEQVVDYIQRYYGTPKSSAGTRAPSGRKA